MGFKLPNEFMPKYVANTRQDQNKGSVLVKVVLVVMLYIFTLGVLSMFEHSNNAMKGRE